MAGRTQRELILFVCCRWGVTPLTLVSCTAYNSIFFESVMVAQSHFPLSDQARRAPQIFLLPHQRLAVPSQRLLPFLILLLEHFDATSCYRVHVKFLQGTFSSRRLATPAKNPRGIHAANCLTTQNSGTDVKGTEKRPQEM